MKHTGTPPAADWKRPPGRPRRNWLQQVEEGVGLSVGAAWIAGQDRLMWRTLRPSAGQAQQWVSEWVTKLQDGGNLPKRIWLLFQESGISVTCIELLSCWQRVELSWSASFPSHPFHFFLPFIFPSSSSYLPWRSIPFDGESGWFSPRKFLDWRVLPFSISRCKFLKESVKHNVQ